jgi:1-acyl-sn-glycerol-3-phosphate acyltransferase
MKRHTYYYQADKTQDFAEIEVDPSKGSTGKIPSDYKYIHNNWLWRAGAWVFYNLLAIPILGIYSKIVYHTKVINKKYVKKQLKGTGYFIYSNHTMTADGWNHPVFTCWPTPAYSISLSSTFMHSKLLGWILEMLKAVPLPGDLKSGTNFLKSLKTRLEKEKAAILIYPEATIWPYYTHQRPVKPGSFKYPRMYNVPVVFACTTFRKPKGPLARFLKPRVVIYLSDPIFPAREKVEKLDENRLQQEYTAFIEKMSSIPENYAANDFVPQQSIEDFMDNHSQEVIDSFLQGEETIKDKTPDTSKKA